MSSQAKTAARIAAIIKDLRLRLGYSQQAFSDRLGLSLVIVNRFEKGHVLPNAGSLVKLEQVALRHGFHDYAAVFHQALYSDCVPCIGGDPYCPCQDGDLCHYRGPDAWPIPRRDTENMPLDAKDKIDLENLKERFTYHAPTGEQPAAYEKLRAKALEFATLIVETCPSSPERSTALTGLDAVVMFSNASIARNQSAE